MHHQYKNIQTAGTVHNPEELSSNIEKLLY